MDSSALSWDRVLCSAGRRHWDVTVATARPDPVDRRGHRRYPGVEQPLLEIGDDFADGVARAAAGDGLASFEYENANSAIDKPCHAHGPSCRRTRTARRTEHRRAPTVSSTMIRSNRGHPHPSGRSRW